MKNSDYSTPPRFEQWVQQERNRSVPQVNVRVAVRSALETPKNHVVAKDALDDLASWFSGARAWVAGSLAGALIVAMALLIFQQIESLQQETLELETDHVSTFIESGDWSELL